MVCSWVVELMVATTTKLPTVLRIISVIVTADITTLLDQVVGLKPAETTSCDELTYDEVLNGETLYDVITDVTAAIVDVVTMIASGSGSGEQPCLVQDKLCFKSESECKLLR